MPSVTKWNVASTHFERCARVMREDEYGSVVRRILAPPSFQESSGHDSRIGPNMFRPMIHAPLFLKCDEVVVGARSTALIANHLSKCTCPEHPFVQRHAADAKGIV